MPTDARVISYLEPITANCRLCNELSAQRERSVWNKPLFESPNFTVVPSLGSLVEGWLLIIPKQHILSAAMLPDSLLPEFTQLKADVCRRLQSEYGPVRVFEHGPALERRTTGCGVDHAHVHLVPLKFNLLNAASKFLPSGVSFQPGTMEGCRSAISKGLDYLYLEEFPGASFVAVHPGFESQVFRKAIAEMLGMFGEYGWREHPKLDNVFGTIQRLGSDFEVSSTVPKLATVPAR